MLDFKQVEKDILKFWEDKKIYDKVKKQNEKGKKFYFLQGPPYTSGKIHLGHAWNSSLKDMILRYKRMNGFNVWDRAGYDMHGLPTENAVQKKLGLKNKDDIEKIGVDKFVKECFRFSEEYAGYMNKDLWKIGFWLDYDNAYMPIRKEFISGQWAFFKKAYEQGRLYKGKKSMHWDAQSETSLAKHELEYETIKETSIFVKFKKKGANEDYFVIWTTTPWTIPYNLGIMVNPDYDYVKVRVENKENWILAKDLASIFMNAVVEKKYEVIDEFKGKDMRGMEYEHFMNEDMDKVYDKLKESCKNVHTILLSKKYVDTTAGTGLVHTAPGCGPEDQEVGNEYGIPAFNTLNERGEIESEGKFKGWEAKIDDKKFVKYMDESGVLIATSEIEHDYPHSWRSHKPVVFRTVEQWFLKIEDLVEDLLKYNDKVKWVPEKSGNSYAGWTKNLRDNSLTRQRYWGCAVPIWVNVKDSEDIIVVGGVDELEKLTGKKFDDLEVHKPWIDKIIIEKGNKRYKRIPDVSDVWIDSGTTSWNCLYNDPKLIKEWFPADFILEGTEMTRQWFSLLQICSAVMFGKSSFKNVFTNGMMLDYQGTKMSKSLGNVLSPYEVIDKYSVDIMRNYVCQVGAGENINFNWEDIKVKQRNLMMLDNVSNYLLDLEKQKVDKGKIGVEEKWILSKYHFTLKEVSELFERYRLDEIIGKVEELYITLSRDYIKFVRDKSGENSSVKETLREVYLGILKMLCPVVPFVSEHLWKKIGGDKESIHLNSWDKYESKKINKKLEEEFNLAMKVIESGLKFRDKQGVGLRWPLSKAEVLGVSGMSEEVKDLIKRQLNVKDVKFSKGESIEVKLDLTMTPELESEGYAREVARAVQSERKNAGLEKGELIDVTLGVSEKLKEMLNMHEEFLKERVNAKTLIIDDKSSFGNGFESIKLKGEELVIKFSSLGRNKI